MGGKGGAARAPQLLNFVLRTRIGRGSLCLVLVLETLLFLLGGGGGRMLSDGNSQRVDSRFDRKVSFHTCICVWSARILLGNELWNLQEEVATGFVGEDLDLCL